MTNPTKKNTYAQTKLGNICKITWGNTSITKSSYVSFGYPAYSASGADGFLNSFDYDEAAIILSAIGARCGKCFLATGKWTAIKNTIVIQPLDNDIINIDFLFHYINREEVWPHDGMAQPFITMSGAQSVNIPLPPLDEQKRIAKQLNEELSAVEAARKAAEEQLELLDKLITSYLRESLETSTQKMRVGDCLVEVKKGIGETWNQYPVLGATREGVAPAKEKVGKQPQRYKLVNAGTVFYNPMRINIGSIAMVDEGDEAGITSPDYVVLKGKDGIIHSRWFYYWLRSHYGENFIKTLARGAVRERMLFNRLDKGEIEIPAYDVQVKVAEKLREIRDLKKAIESQLEEINALPSALLGRAFEGNL